MMTFYKTRLGTWPTLCGTLILIGAAWLSVDHSGSEASVPGEVAYRPMAGSLNGASEKSEQSASPQARHPLDDALEFVQPSVQAVKNIDDYTATFTKTELIHGRLLTQNMDMKFRASPFSVYLQGRSNRKPGREVIFVAGRNDGKLFVHEVGLKSIVGTMTLKPEDAKVMDTNRHSITEIGIAKVLESAIEIWKHDKETVDPANVDVRIARNVEVCERVCDAVEVSYRSQQPELAYQVGRIYVDCQTRLPVQAELYGWPTTPDGEAPLLERYSYTDVTTNVGLSDTDFDPSNPAYRFNISPRN